MTFRDMLNEEQNKNLIEVEDKLLKLNPAKFIQGALKVIDDSWYWANKPNFKRYGEQNNIGNSYTVGSLYDVFRNYRYAGPTMSSKVKELIDTKIPVITSAKFDKYSKEFKYEGSTMVVEFDYSKFKALGKAIENGEKTSSLVKYIDPTVYGTIAIDGKAVAWGTYRTRAKVDGNDFIKKRDLVEALIAPLKQWDEDLKYNSKLKETVTQVMIDEVIKDYIIDTTKEEVVISKKMNLAKNVGEFVEVLKQFGFEGIPSDDKVLKGLFDSKSTYTEERPDGYGHTTGTTWQIQLSTKRITSQSWSSDD